MYRILLSILSGVLMGVAFPNTGGLNLVFFIALVPLFFVEYQLTQNKVKLARIKVFLNAYLTFLTFNIFSTWWIFYASPAGVFMAVALNAMFSAIVFTLYSVVKQNLGFVKGLIGFLFLWIGFEWVHYNWELSYPWLVVGNTFANTPKLVQWYEYTGVLGGSLWVLLVNVLIFSLVRRLIILKTKIVQEIKLMLILIVTIALPVLCSLMIYTNYFETNDSVEVVVVQPNIDPYSEKFSGLTDKEQVDKIIKLTTSKITKNTAYVVAPETAIPKGYWEDELKLNYGVQEVKRLVNSFPKTKYVIGVSTYKDFPNTKGKPTESARMLRGGGWYDAYNTAMYIDKTDSIQLYHKSKLVLGVEKVPFTWLLAPLADYAIDLGGTFGSLGVDPEPGTFITDTLQSGAAICYESIYGEYFSEFVAKGAQIMFVITNDGWWEDTPGYKQHLNFARLRAIETRRSIARSANTGVSALINQRGDLIQQTKWWKPAVLSGNLNLNSKLTFYTQNGDYIGRIATFFSLLIIIWGFVSKYKT